MRTHYLALMLCAGTLLASAALADTGSPFYGDPPDENHPWAVHDRNRPQPPLVAPGTPSTQQQPGKPPSDAIILFDGTAASLDKWEADKPGHEPTKWIVKDGAFQCVPGSGYVRTKEQFGDCQLHIEWAAPGKPEGESQGRGNSGVFLEGLMEIQVLDNYNNPTYADGFAASVYGINPPMANALRPPGEYQVYDITFRRPVYKDGKVLDPGHVTVFLNGVCVQECTALEGPGGHMRRSHAGPFPAAGPLKLQDHGNPVRYRNIWYRPLPPRSVEGGTDGALSPEATIAKRKQIAATVRDDAARLQGTNQLLRYAESLVYEKDPATMQKVETMAADYVTNVKQLTGEKLSAKKDEVRRIAGAFGYLTRWKILPADFAPKAELDKLIKQQGWDKR